MEFVDVYKHSDITNKLIGAAIKVHKYFGPGYPEIIYKRALVIESNKRQLDTETEVEQDIYYENVLIGKRRLDMLANKKVLVEIKAVREIDNACIAQIINYLKVFKLEVGLLLNFGADSLLFRRFVNSTSNQ